MKHLLTTVENISVNSDQTDAKKRLSSELIFLPVFDTALLSYWFQSSTRAAKPLQLASHLSITRSQEHVVLVVCLLLPPPPLFLLHEASGDKLWMQRKSCKICCIFHYLHVKGHKSSSVKSAIKK